MESFAERMQMISIQIVPFFLAVVAHEFGHGYVAYRWGDTTAKDAGRLTLNPLPHLDPIGTVLFPLINMISGMTLLFGWARPVPIDPRLFKKYRPGLFWVSFAGPGMNFLLALFSAAIFCAMRLWVPEDFYLHKPLISMAAISISINYALGIFNLIPLPPLDGSKMIQSFLPHHWAMKYESLTRFSLFILIALLLTGALSVLRYPIVFATELTLYGMALVFQLPEVL